MRPKVLLCGLILSTINLSEGTGGTGTPPYLLSETPARMLAGQAYCNSTDCAKWFEPFDPEFEKGQFYIFEGLGPTAGAFGYFVVNKWTGAVWNLWDCKQISTPASKAAQAKLRLKFKPDEQAEYDRLNSIKPECD